MCVCGLFYYWCILIHIFTCNDHYNQPLQHVNRKHFPDEDSLAFCVIPMFFDWKVLIGFFEHKQHKEQ